MLNSSKKNNSTTENIRRKLNAKLQQMNKHLAIEVPPLPADEQKYATARLQMLQADCDFGTLANDCVDLMVYLGNNMAKTASVQSRYKQVSHMEMLYNLYHFFADLNTNKIAQSC